MSLTKPSLMDVVKKQYRYKLKAYIQVFMSLIFIQLLGLFFSFNGVGSAGTSSESLEIEVRYFSADIVVAFTIIWGFITAILITTKAYRNDDFAFVTNRLCSNSSNIMFLLTASLIGGFTAMLSSYLMKVVMYFVGGHLYLESKIELNDLLLGIFITSFYIFISCAVGYLIGTLVQIHKLFAGLLPVLFFGTLILGGINGKTPIVAKIFTFFFMETSIVLFIVKVFITLLLLFTSAFVLSNRMEVKQ